MYQIQLNVQIFSDNNLIATILHEIAPLDHFTHTIHTATELDLKILATSDIIILAIPVRAMISKIRTYCKKTAQIILCTTEPQSLDPIIYQYIDDIWLTPINSAYLNFKFNKLLENIKLCKDYNLTQNYLHTTIDSIPDLVWFKDLRGAHLEINDAFCKAVGKTKSDIKGRGHFYIWDMKAEEYEKGEYICLESEEIVVKARQTCLFDEKVKSKNGMRQFKTYKSPLFDDTGTIIGTVGIAHDVTDLENMNAELEIILRSLPFAIIIKNDKDIIINANDKFEEYFHTKKTNIIGKQYTDWKQSTTNMLLVNTINNEAEIQLYLGDEVKILHLQEEAIRDIFNNLVGYICIYNDITLERTFEEQILHSANTDFLTGLYNRRFFYTYISKHRTTQQTTLFSLDLDYFKHVNDTYGHQTGDEALVIAANVIKELFPNDLITRTGGDEFLVALLGEYTLSKLRKKAQFLLQKMRLTFAATEKFKVLSVSIGIATTTDSTLKIDELLKHSDLALYEAKQRGKSQYYIYK